MGKYAFNINTGNWREIESGVIITAMTLDENAQILVYDDNDKKIHSLAELESPGVEIGIKTKTFPLSDERPESVRYVYVTYLSASDLTLNLYAENAAVAVATKTLPSNSVVTTYKIAIRYRAKKFAIEIIDDVASQTDSEIYNIKIETE